MPWRGKKDVERHNKKCSQYGACRKIWLRAANDHYTRTGDDGQAVIRANVASKKWLQAHGKYRRNVDEDIRQLEREAYRGDELANARYRQAQIRAGLIPPIFPDEGLWVNAYVNNQAKASLHASSYEEVDDISQFLLTYFTTPPMKSEEYETYDMSLGRMVTVPEESLQIATEENPAFDFREGRPWPRPYHYEPYVSFTMIESLSDELSDLPEETELDDWDNIMFHWVNVYSVERVCGSAAEGGDWYNHNEPLGCLYINAISLADSRDHNYPSHIEAAHNFLHTVYDGRAYGNIYSVRGGVEIHIFNEEEPARRTGPYHYE